MKQIPLLQGKALLIEIPEGAKMEGLQITSPNAIVYADTHGHGVILDLPPGNWRIIGMLSDVREKDVKHLVKYISDWGYINHGVKTQVREMLLKTALESLESSILAEGWCFENPYGEEPTHLEHMRAGWLDNPITDDVRRVWNWKEAQSRVLCRERCLLLGREG